MKPSDHKQGTIIKALSGFYYIYCEAESKLYTTRARGVHRYAQWTPLVGDVVYFSTSSDTEGSVEDCLPRSNVFLRPPVANIQQLILVCSEAIPKTDPFLVDRFTSLCAMEHCEPIIVINKCDLASGEELYQLYRSCGFITVKTSAETGEGIPQLQALLSGKISAFAGNSGVGKSSILNAIDPNMALATGEVSQKLGRGRHTTRHVELFPLAEGGYIADTPGFTAIKENLELEDIRELPHTFLEFRPYLEQCQFQNCSHTKEKGCAVLEAVEEGEILPSRHSSYLRLYQQCKEIVAWEKPKSKGKSSHNKGKKQKK